MPRLPALVIALVLALPAPALAGLLDARAGGPGKPATTGLSIGAVADWFSIGDLSTMGAVLDAQIPIGMPLRARVPLSVTGSEGLDDPGLGNVVVGTVRGIELGFGVETSLVVGVDLALPTNRSTATSIHPLRGPLYAPKTTSLIPHAAFGLDLPVIDARIHAEVIYPALVDTEIGEDAALQVGAVAAVSFFPFLQLALAVDVVQDIKGEGDLLAVASPGLRASLPPLVDVGLHVPIVVAGAVGDDTHFGVTLDVAVGL